MRVEATLPEVRGQQLDEAARDLGVSRSELISKALARPRAG
jgi:metal-responsive CopG/Arc/MetJ family transcriptional regulator